MKPTALSPDRHAALNAGEVAATTLAECLAVDFAILMRSVFPDAGGQVLQAMDAAAALGISRRMALAAELIIGRYGPEVIRHLADHPSDTVRGWACFAVGRTAPADHDLWCAAIRPFADDGHFGVREWAWLAIRDRIAADIPGAIAALMPWTAETSPRLRRFASEATRPRGVWCAHLKPLKADPTPGFALLEPLKADPETYVQDSVGNWLNDAAKDRPEAVLALTGRWQTESPCPATARICRRGLRSIRA